VILCKSHL